MLQEFEKKTKEKLFWDWFRNNSERYYLLDMEDESMFDELINRLKEVDKNLTFEMGPPGRDGVREFIISADGIIESFSAVINLVELAPKMKKWKIVAFRPRIKGDDIMVEYGDDLLLSYDDVFFKYFPDSNKIGVELHIRDYGESEDVDSAVFILLDSLIGEYDMEMEIGWIDRTVLNDDEMDDLLPMIELRKIVDGNKLRRQN